MDLSLTIFCGHDGMLLSYCDDDWQFKSQDIGMGVSWNNVTVKNCRIKVGIVIMGAESRTMGP